jgi:predicted nuclease with TOPRIM domain
MGFLGDIGRDLAGIFRSSPRSRDEWVKRATRDEAQKIHLEERIKEIPKEIKRIQEKMQYHPRERGFYTKKIEDLYRELKKGEEQLRITYRRLSSTPGYAKQEGLDRAKDNY